MGKVLFFAVCVVLAIDGVVRADDGLKDRLKDVNATQSDVWVYNNIPQAMEAARKQNKPLFVTFRCVPCKDCAAFDADVASGNERVKTLAKERFVSVRQVEMKGVDLSLFQFDHDLNWAGMFLNAEGVIYARYGTQSSEGSDAYNSIDGLLNTMERVLKLHEDYPGNLEQLKGKRGSTKVTKNALELPGLRNPAKYAQQTTRQNCIHCHNIHDAEHQAAVDLGTYSPELLWKYPLPDNIGLKIDRKSGIRIADVVKDSPAASAGMKADDEITLMDGQLITSIADIQWVLHHLSNDLTELTIQTSTSREPWTLKLNPGWKQYDFSWRGSMWNAPPRFQVWAPVLNEESRQKLEIPGTDSALEVRWINRGSSGGNQVFDDGLREKDVIVALAGKPFQMNTREFNVHLKLNYKVGDILPLTVIRDGERKELKLRLVE